eukprot:GILI01023952.1.p2 GENE.GILI01023952.1~~GILI01023952.1.p2  ORF type:complete len:143 (-),score=43.10 GILI01023952.1:42-470(-)
MADIDVQPEVQEQVEAAPAEPLSFEQALAEVLKKSLIHDGLARGLKECVKALDRREAHLCILAKSCDEPSYVKLITALCDEHRIRLISVDDGKTLGEMAGLCKIDNEGKARKVVSCSCVVIRSWGEESNARAVLMEHLKNVA